MTEPTQTPPNQAPHAKTQESESPDKHHDNSQLEEQKQNILTLLRYTKEAKEVREESNDTSQAKRQKWNECRDGRIKLWNDIMATQAVLRPGDGPSAEEVKEMFIIPEAYSFDLNLTPAAYEEWEDELIILGMFAGIEKEDALSALGLNEGPQKQLYHARWDDTWNDMLDWEQKAAEAGASKQMAK